jgi:RNA polymerase sigma-70 factor, ECF subfamily
MNICYSHSDEYRTPQADCPHHSRDLILELLFQRHASRVYNLARRMLSNDADAEDIMQDVFLQVARKWDTFRGEAEVTTWLHRITVNSVLLHRRRAARRPERTMTPAPEGVFGRLENATPRRSVPVSTVQQMLRRELKQLIDRAVADLPAIYRDVFFLADIEGLSNDQVGRLLRLSLPAVKSRLHRARSMIRGALAPHFAGNCAS